MNLESVQKDFDRAKANLEDIRVDLTKRQAEYIAAEQAHANQVAKNAGRKRYPRSLQVQRDSLLRLKMEIEVLEKAEKIAEENLANAQTTLQLAGLYENMVKPYQQAEQIYFKMAEEVIAAVEDLNVRTSKVSVLVDKFVEQSGNPIVMLKSLINDPALSGLSLIKLFDGEIAEATAVENDCFVDDLATRCSEITRRLPELQTAVDSWEALSDHLFSIARDASTLIPKHVKHTPVEAASARPEVQAQEGQLLPRHAQGGPEIDEKEDYGSDYWVRRRAALRPVKDATTVLGKAKGILSNV